MSLGRWPDRRGRDGGGRCRCRPSRCGRAGRNGFETAGALIDDPGIAARKPVLGEEPLAATAAERRDLVHAETAPGRRLTPVGYMRRFDPGYLAMKAALTAGETGAPAVLHNPHRNASAPPWCVGAMPIANSLVHEPDISRWLLDTEPTFATVHGGRGGGPFLVVLQTATGALVSNEIHMNAVDGCHVAAELVRRSGSLRLTHPARLTKNAVGQHGRTFPGNWVPRFAAADVARASVWVQSVKTGTPAGASTWDSYVATALAEQIAPALTAPGPQPQQLPDRPVLYRTTPA